VRAVAGSKQPSIGKVQQGPQLRTAEEDDITAMSTIATIWAATRYILFATETDATAPPIATPNLHPYTINEVGQDTHSLDSAGIPVRQHDYIRFNKGALWKPGEATTGPRQDTATGYGCMN